MGNCNQNRSLINCTLSNTPAYTFEGQVMKGKIVDVYDGDTCKAAVNINGAYQVITIRCYGYDSPEMKPPLKNENRDQEIKAAKLAKTALEEMILGRIVKLHFGKSDKYGRFLATIYAKPTSRFPLFRQFTVDVNDYMVTSGFGTPYFGGTKGVPINNTKSGAKKKKMSPARTSKQKESAPDRINDGGWSLLKL